MEKIKLLNDLVWDKKHKKLLIFFYIVIAISFCSYTYSDILITVRHGINFWEFLFSGKITQYYAEGTCVAGNMFYTSEYSMVYPFPVYLLFAVLNLPLYILEKLGVDVMNNLFCLIYMKLPLLIAVLVSSEACRKIYILKNGEDKYSSLIPFYFLTSMTVISSVFIISQYDIYAVVLMLIGVYYYLKNDKNKFILFFGISVCFKYFALMVFIPLILLSNRNFLKILKSLILGILPIVIVKIISTICFSAEQTGNQFTEQQIEKLFFSEQFNIGLSAGNYFITVYVFLCLICIYISYCKIDRDKFKEVSIVGFVVYASFMVCTGGHPYWAILFTPFLVLLTFDNKNRLVPTMIFENVFSCGLIFWQILHYTWCFSSNTVMPMLWGKLFLPENKLFYKGIGNIISDIFSGINIIPFIISITIASFIAVLFICLNKSQQKEQINNNINTIKLVVWIRASINILIGLIPLGFFFLQVILWNLFLKPGVDNSFINDSILYYMNVICS